MAFAGVSRKEDAGSGLLAYAMKRRNVRFTEQSVYAALLKQLADFTLRFDPRQRKIPEKKKTKQTWKERKAVPSHGVTIRQKPT